MVRKTKKYKKTKKISCLNNETGDRNGNGNGNRNRNRNRNNNKQKKLKWNSRKNKFKRNTKKMSGGSGGINFCYTGSSTVTRPITRPITNPIITHKIVIEFSPIFRKQNACVDAPIVDEDNRYLKEHLYYLNPGNLCYAISSVQLLRNIIELLGYINILDTQKADLANAAGNMLLTAKEKKEKQEKLLILEKHLPLLQKILNPVKQISDNDILLEITKSCFPTNPTSQQDAPEFLRKINFLDYIPELQFYTGVEFYDKNNTFLKQMTNDLNTQEITVNVFLTLEVTKNNSANNIQELFDYTQKAEQFTVGNDLQISTNPDKYIESGIKFPFYFVKSDNKYLILSVNIYDNRAAKVFFNIDKIGDDLCIRELSDNELSDTDPTKQFNNGKSTKYELISVICQIGSANSGHYANFSKQIIAQIDTKKPKWVYYNDSYSNNSAIDNESIFLNKQKKMKYIMDDIGVNYIENDDDINLLNQKHHTPYVFLYKRINTTMVISGANPYSPKITDKCNINGEGYNLCSDTNEYVINKFNLFNLLEKLKVDPKNLNKEYSINSDVMTEDTNFVTIYMNLQNALANDHLTIFLRQLNRQYPGKTAKHILNSLPE